MDLVQDRLDAIAKAARAKMAGAMQKGSSTGLILLDARPSEPAGERSDRGRNCAAGRDRGGNAAGKRVDEDDHDYDDELRALTRKQDAIVSACRVFTAEQKAEHSLIVFIGHDGIEQVAFTRTAKGTAADGPKPPRPDYCRKSWISWVASARWRFGKPCQRPGAAGRALNGPLRSRQRLFVATSRRNHRKREETASMLTMRSWAIPRLPTLTRSQGPILDRLAEHPRWTTCARWTAKEIAAAGSLRCLADHEPFLFHSDRDRQLAQIVGAAQINMADKWEPIRYSMTSLARPRSFESCWPKVAATTL
jgi:ParB family chromosome partitioning protein